LARNLTPMKRPVTLTIAVVLQWLAAVIAVIAGFDLIAAAMEMSQAGVATQVEAALVNQGIVDVTGEFVVVGVFVAGVLLMAIAFVRVMVAVYLGRGRTWARIVVAVLVLISLAGGVGYLFQGYVVQAAVSIGVDLLVLWLLFNARSSAYIAARSAER
jgi:hypothetical protein